MHNGFGLGLGYLAGKVGRLDDKARRALAFEVGMQNSGLAAADVGLQASHLRLRRLPALPVKPLKAVQQQVQGELELELVIASLPYH